MELRGVRNEGAERAPRLFPSAFLPVALPFARSLSTSGLHPLGLEIFFSGALRTERQPDLRDCVSYFISCRAEHFMNRPGMQWPRRSV